MIVNDLDILGTRSCPAEADVKRIVHPDTVLTSPVSLECCKSVTMWNTEILQSSRDLQLAQLAPPDALDLLKPLDPPTASERLSIGIPERYDHLNIITYGVINVMRDYSDGVEYSAFYAGAAVNPSLRGPFPYVSSKHRLAVLA